MDVYYASRSDMRRIFCRVRPILPADLALQRSLESTGAEGSGSLTPYDAYNLEQQLNSYIRYIDYNVGTNREYI